MLTGRHSGTHTGYHKVLYKHSWVKPHQNSYEMYKMGTIKFFYRVTEIQKVQRNL